METGHDIFDKEPELQKRYADILLDELKLSNKKFDRSLFLGYLFFLLFLYVLLSDVNSIKWLDFQLENDLLSITIPLISLFNFWRNIIHRHTIIGRTELLIKLNCKIFQISGNQASEIVPISLVNRLSYRDSHEYAFGGKRFRIPEFMFSKMVTSIQLLTVTILTFNLGRLSVGESYIWFIPSMLAGIVAWVMLKLSFAQQKIIKKIENDKQ